MSRRKSRFDKNSTKRLQNKTVKNAYRQGMAWNDDEVATLVNGIQDDKTTFDIAMSIGRTYYGVQSARAHVRFALDHRVIFERAVRGTTRKR